MGWERDGVGGTKGSDATRTLSICLLNRLLGTFTKCSPFRVPRSVEPYTWGEGTRSERWRYLYLHIYVKRAAELYEMYSLTDLSVALDQTHLTFSRFSLYPFLARGIRERDHRAFRIPLK